MRNKFNAFKFIIFIFLLMILSSVFLMIISRGDDIMYKRIHTPQPIDGIMLDNAKVTFPAEIHFEEGETKTFTYRLPEELGSDYALCYDAQYLGQEISVDGVTIYSFATKPMLPFGKMRGSAYVIAPIKPEDAGKLVTIKMTNPFQSFEVTFPGIHLTNPGDYKFSLLRNNLWRVRVGMFLFTLSLIMFIRGINLLKLKIDSRNSFAFIYFAFLSLSVATWIMSDAVVMQLYSSKTVVAQYTAVLALLAFSAFYTGLCACLFLNETATLHIVEMLGYILFVVMFITYVADLLDPISFLPVVFIYFFVSIITSCVITIRNLAKKTYAKFMLLGMLGLFIAITVGIYMYISNPTGSNYFKPAIVAYSIYLLILFLILIRYERDIINNAMQMESYKGIAYTDKLTGLANRAAYEQAMDELDNIRNEEHEVLLFIGDLNNLKKVNDTYGHEAGDKLICGAAECFDKVFHNIGKAFRLGGDEFAALVIDSPIDEEHLYSLLESCVDECNEKEDLNLSFAVNHASVSFPDFSPDIRGRLFREADQKMYATKLAMKRHQS